MCCPACALMVSQRPLFGSGNRAGTEREPATNSTEKVLRFPGSRSVPGTLKTAWIKAFKSIYLVSISPHTYSLLTLFGLVFLPLCMCVCPPRKSGTGALAEPKSDTPGAGQKYGPTDQPQPHGISFGQKIPFWSYSNTNDSHW
jgi:hypothetical protein